MFLGPLFGNQANTGGVCHGKKHPTVEGLKMVQNLNCDGVRLLGYSVYGSLDGCSDL